MKQLTIDEMLSAAQNSGMPGFKGLAQILTATADVLADALAEHLQIERGMEAEFLQGMGGICVAFGPSTPKQPIPEAIEPFDQSADWYPAEMAPKRKRRYLAQVNFSSASKVGDKVYGTLIAEVYAANVTEARTLALEQGRESHYNDERIADRKIKVVSCALAP